MEFLEEALVKYVDQHTDNEPEILKKLNRETHLKIKKPRMLSGHFQGRFLSFLSKMYQPKRILEIGTYTGYSALCMAEGLSSDGELITIDVNEELEAFANKYFIESGKGEQIIQKIGDAREIIPSIDGDFDFVFIDADKINYGVYYDMIVDRVPRGGIIILDNVLWSGKVVTGPSKPSDKDTSALMELNDRLHHDDRVENILLPIRDGLMILRKK